MGSLSQEVLKTVKIPVPPLSIQRKIVGEVQNRREKAKRLGEYSKELLEKVKTQIEELILRAD